MDFDHVHFYVADAVRSRDWFVHTLGFQAVSRWQADGMRTEVVQSGAIYFVLSSALAPDSPVARYLQDHPAGVTDLAFRVRDLPYTLEQAMAGGARLLQPIQTLNYPCGQLQWAKVGGWGELHHTLIQRTGLTPLLPDGSATQPVVPAAPISISSTRPAPLLQIDHVVLNVAAGDLSQALAWYQQVFGFSSSRRFEIQTSRSALRSEVLVHPEGRAQLPINEPLSAGSQIQEFLNVNHGPGIQHIALQTNQILSTVAQLRRQGLKFLDVPPSYYTQLRQRLPDWMLALDWQRIEQQQILVDWQASQTEALLLQIFTQPIFAEPTFFLEIIERRSQAQGFGEGNFMALFEAIEQEQIKRGTLV